jgi:hypothetical protein
MPRKKMKVFLMEADSEKADNERNGEQRQVEYTWRPVFDDTSEIKEIAAKKAQLKDRQQ